jgi:hypothetical protein
MLSDDRHTSEDILSLMRRISTNWSAGPTCESAIPIVIEGMWFWQKFLK